MYSSFTNTGLLKNRAGKAVPCQTEPLFHSVINLFKNQVLIVKCHENLGRQSIKSDMVYVGIISNEENTTLPY